MPTIKVPKIKIPKIDIPKTPLVPEHVLTGNIPGCNLYHRDLEITKNPSILYNDRNAYITCPEGEMPSFNPIEYDPSKLIKTVTPTQSPQQPEYRPVIPKIKEDFGKDFITVTPGIRIKQKSNDQSRVASLAEATKNGSDYIVLGREITASKNISKMIKEVESYII